MQQLRLLNFHKILANISTNLVGAFIPLIVLQATNNVGFAVLAYIMMYVVRFIFNYILKKYYEKYPQIILLLRIIPMVCYSIFIILIDTNLWVGIFGAVFFYGVNNSFKCLPNEIVYNYASSEKSEGKSPLGFSRLLEQVGVLVALIVGGVMLDFNKTLIVVISVVIYLISVIPLVIYYIRSHNEKTFNKDSISNAQMLYNKKPELKNNATKISKKILLMYALTYFVFCMQDCFGSIFNIHIFLKTNSFGSAGYVNAIYNFVYGIGCYLFSYFDSKKDTTLLVALSCIGNVGVIASLILINYLIWWHIAVVFLGLFYGFICTYVLGRLLPKSRIMGVSNEALFYRENASNLSVIFVVLFGLFGGAAPMLPVLWVVAGSQLVASALIPFNEEYTRKKLILYLQNHEKAMTPQEQKSKVPEIYEKPNDIVVVNVEKYKKTSKNEKLSTDKKTAAKQTKNTTVTTKVERKTTTKKSTSKGDKK